MNQQPTMLAPAGAPSATEMAMHSQRPFSHMVMASTPAVLALFWNQDPYLTLLLAATTVVVLGDITRLKVKRLNGLFCRLFRPLLRQREESQVTGASYALLGTLGTFVLFSNDVAILAVLFMSLGDPVAAMVGIRAPGWRIHSKSLWGTAAMITVGLAATGVVHITGAISFRWPAAIGTVAAGITELLPLPMDDNLRVPLVAGAAMSLLGM